MRTLLGVGIAFALLSCIAYASGNEQGGGPAAGFSAVFLFMSFAVWLWKILDGSD